MKQTKQPIIHLVIFAIFLAMGMVMFYLTQEQLRLTGLALASADQLATSQTNLADLSVQLPVYTRQALIWQAALPANEKEVAGFAARIEQLARDNNLTIALTLDDFPGPVDVSGRYIAGVGTAINLEGGYADVTDFLFNLSRLPYFFKIDKLTLTKPDTGVGVKVIINGSLMMNLPV